MIGYTRIDETTYYVAEHCNQIMQVYDITTQKAYDLLKEMDTNDILIISGDELYRFIDNHITTDNALAAFGVDINRLVMDPIDAHMNIKEILRTPVAELPLCQADVLPDIAE